MSTHIAAVKVIDRHSDGTPRVFLAHCVCKQACATPYDGVAARWVDSHPRVMQLLNSHNAA